MIPETGIAPETELRPHADVMDARLDESETVLLSLSAGRYYSLNATGALIWEAMRDGVTEDELARLLEGSFDVTHAEALGHVHAFTAELLREELAEARTSMDPRAREPDVRG